MKTPRRSVRLPRAALAVPALASSASARVVGRLYVNGPVTNATAKSEVAGGPTI